LSQPFPAVSAKRKTITITKGGETGAQQQTEHTTTITSCITSVETIYHTPEPPPQCEQGKTDVCSCEPTTSTVYATTVTMTVAKTTHTETKTVQPPYPHSLHGTGTGTGTGRPRKPYGTGTGATREFPNSVDTPTATGAAGRRWFRRGQA
jgi:hypothetical protein